jgi:hypothetical protein
MTLEKLPDPTDPTDTIPLTFGKHKGRTPEQIADIDPGYVAWLYDRCPGSVSHELYVACVEECDDIDDDSDPESRPDYW